MNMMRTLLKLVKKLRNPVNGCPWDKKQTEDSIKEYVIEEAYELIEAIDKNDIKMFEQVGTSITYRGKPEVVDIVDYHVQDYHELLEKLMKDGLV